MTKSGWKTISARVTEDQENELRKRAENSGMSLNEYIKARLLIDDDQEISYKTNNFDKWIIKALASILVTSEEIARKTLTEEEQRNINRNIVDLVKRSGFLKEHEIFKNNDNS